MAKIPWVSDIRFFINCPYKEDVQPFEPLSGFKTAERVNDSNTAERVIGLVYFYNNFIPALAHDSAISSGQIPACTSPI